MWAILTEDWSDIDLPGRGFRAALAVVMSPLLSVPATIGAGYVLVRFGPPRRFTRSLWAQIFLGGTAAAFGLTFVAVGLSAGAAYI